MRPFSADISIISSCQKKWEINQLKEAALKYKLKLNFIDFNNINDIDEKIKRLGKIVIYCSSNLRLPLEQAIFKTPFIPYQLYQQKIIEKKINLNYVSPKILQTINTYQVFVFGGKVLGMIKIKTTDNKEFHNNLSLAIKPSAVEDKEVVQKLTARGLKTASLFNLQMCSIDIIFDQQAEKYRVTKVNTAPNWQDLQLVCELNIGEEIIKHCKQLLDRETKPVVQLVKDHYHSNYPFLSYKQFHYASRNYLWFGKKVDCQRLKKLEERIFNDQEIDQAFQKCFDQAEENNKSKYSLRKKYLKEYPTLKTYCRILFKYLMAKNLFKKDISHLVEKYVSKEELKDLQIKLLNNPRAIMGLSTPAVNFLYLSKYYLGSKSSKISPEYFLKIINKFKTKDKQEIRLKIYNLTHCIIGASLFYTRDLNRTEKRVYQKFAKEIEETIINNYFQVTLDNKFEFLVVAELCDYQSSLKKIIESEAESSLSNFGNYLIDQLPKTEKTYGDNLLSSEHRNILYLMAMLPRKK